MEGRVPSPDLNEGVIVSEGRSFWSSMPALVTGVATILTGVAALLPFLISRGNDTPAAPEPSVSSTLPGTPSPSASAPTLAGSPTLSPIPPSSSPNAPALTPTAATSAATRALITPRNLDFGKQTVANSSETQTVTLANVGSTTLVISSLAVSGPDKEAFSIIGGCGPGAVVGPEGECPITLRFSPRATGSFTASLVVSHNAPGGPATATLTGTGAIL